MLAAQRDPERERGDHDHGIAGQALRERDRDHAELLETTALRSEGRAQRRHAQQVLEPEGEEPGAGAETDRSEAGEIGERQSATAAPQNEREHAGVDAKRQRQWRIGQRAERVQAAAEQRSPAQSGAHERRGAEHRARREQAAPERVVAEARDREGNEGGARERREQRVLPAGEEREHHGSQRAHRETEGQVGLAHEEHDPLGAAPQLEVERDERRREQRGRLCRRGLVDEGPVAEQESIRNRDVEGFVGETQAVARAVEQGREDDPERCEGDAGQDRPRRTARSARGTRRDRTGTRKGREPDAQLGPGHASSAACEATRTRPARAPRHGPGPSPEERAV